MSKVPEGVDIQRITVVARRVLLDGLMALREHRSAITVIGAQAVYLRSATAAIRAAAYTSDGDLGIDPELLVEWPLLEEALRGAGFDLIAAGQAGLWAREEDVDGKTEKVELDLLVGSTLAGGGRGAELPPHAKNAVRKVPGLEPAVVDRSPMTIGSLEEGDDRVVEVNVAGVAALMIAKAFKLKERLDRADRRPDRVVAKDAGDVYRMMMTASPRETASTFRSLIEHPRVGETARTGLDYLRELFGGPRTAATELAVLALAVDVPEERIRAVAPAFVKALAD